MLTFLSKLCSMKIKLFLFCLTVLITGLALGQKNFRTEYHTFRFKLHDLLGEDNPMQISNATARYISKFLEDHSKEIPDFRISQLQMYQREGIEVPDQYTSLDESDLQTVRKLALLITSKETLAEMVKNDKTDDRISPNKDNKEIDNLSVMLEFLRVSPLELILMTNSQLLPTMLKDHAQIASDQLGTVFGRLGVTGAYLSTQKKDKMNWIVTVNSYYVVNVYAVNVITGTINLTEARIRMK